MPFLCCSVLNTTTSSDVTEPLLPALLFRPAYQKHGTLGVVTIDGDDPNARLNFTFPSSGATGDFGFAATGHNNTAFSVERLVFNSQTDRGRLLVDAVASGAEMNYTSNPTGVNPDTGGSVFDDPASYISSVGLYNHHNDLVAIAKLSNPVKKDEATILTGQVKLDF